MRKLLHHPAGRMLLGLALAAQAPAAFAQSADLAELTLAQAELLLQSRNRELLAARRALEAAQANTLTAGARPNPTLSLGISTINPQAGVGSGPWRDKTVDSSIRCCRYASDRSSALADARLWAVASAEDLSDAYRQQRIALRSAYYELLFAQDKTSIARDNAMLFGASTRAAELRLKAGDIAAADVARLRVDALRAANDARAAEADLRRAQLALAYLIGAEAQAGAIQAVDPWPAVANAAEGGVTDELIERRPDVRAAKIRLEAARSARELARSLG